MLASRREQDGSSGKIPSGLDPLPPGAYVLLLDPGTLIEWNTHVKISLRHVVLFILCRTCIYSGNLDSIGTEGSVFVSEVS